MLAPGKADLGWGIVFGSFVSLTPIVVPFVIRKLRRALDIRGVIKVVQRRDPLYTYLEPEAEYCNKISLLGNVLCRDIFGQSEFRELLLKNQSNELFSCRVCIYSPTTNNTFLRQRSEDEVANKIIEVAVDTTKSQSDKDSILKELIDDRLQHNIEQIGETVRIVKELQGGTQTEKGLGDKLKVRFVHNTYILDSILIADDKVVVCDYLHRSGRYTPVLVLTNSPVADKYKEEFEMVWSFANDVP
ncbi:MAG: hypothetical protein HY033_06970 [Ignavibacteriae bacterium]|nr:hypothetical protein [Ignavibacteria bacterium]MBI3364634.1 hypothetical protein [Ignavibacteriota bacterium]